MTAERRLSGRLIGRLAAGLGGGLSGAVVAIRRSAGCTLACSRTGWSASCRACCDLLARGLAREVGVSSVGCCFARLLAGWAIRSTVITGVLVLGLAGCSEGRAGDWMVGGGAGLIQELVDCFLWGYCVLASSMGGCPERQRSGWLVSAPWAKLRGRLGG